MEELKMKRFFVVMILLLTDFTMNAQKWEWLQVIRPGGNEYVWDITNDLQGNTIATGRVKATSTFGWAPNTVTPPWRSGNQTDAFLVKYRPNGELVWARRDGGKEQDWGRGLVADKDGNIYTVGEFRDTAYFVNKVVYAVKPGTIANMYLAKYDSTGNCMWVAQAGNAKQSTIAHGVTLDDEGNLFITGFVNDISDFGNGITAGTAGKHLSFVAKYSSAGVCQWVKILNTTVYGNGNDIVYSKSGFLYITGEFKGILTVNNVQYKSIGTTYEDIYTAKMDKDGNFVWVTIGNGSQTDLGNRLDVDSYDNVYVTGQFEATLTMDTTSLTSDAFSSGFLVKYNKDGKLKWLIGLIGQGNDYSSDVKVFNDKNIFISGHVSIGAFKLAKDNLNCPGSCQIVACIDTLGNRVWHKLGEGTGSNTSKGVCLDSYGNIFSGGFFDGNIILDTISTTSPSANGLDGSIAKLFPKLHPLVTGSQPEICVGGTIQYEVNQPGYPITYEWSFPGGTPSNSSSLNPAITYNNPGIYNVQLITKNHHETDTLFLTSYVTVNTPPKINLGPDASVCSQHTIQLDAGSGMQAYLWNDGSTSQKLTVSNGGKYFVNVTNACGSAADTIIVNQLLSPLVNIGNDTSICNNTSLKLDAGKGMSIYTWNTGQHTQTISTDTAGTYFVTATANNGCSASDTIKVDVRSAPVVKLDVNPQICQGQKIILDAGPDQVKYVWNDSSSMQTLEVDKTGDYFVTVTNSFNCSASDTTHVSVSPLPSVDLGPPVSACKGQVVVLNAGTVDNAYLWNDGSTNPFLNVSSSGSYYVLVKNLQGCTNSDTTSVDIHPLPVVSLGPDTVICKPATILLDAGPGFDFYKWNDGSTGQTFTASTTGNYYVIVQDQNGCEGSDTVKITVEICTGVDDNGEQTEIIIYPNPASDHISIRIDGIGKRDNNIIFSLFNSLGVNVISQYLRSPETNINIENVIGGGYYYQLEMDGKIIKRGKIIIQ